MIQSTTWCSSTSIMRHERDILEHAVRNIAEQAAKADGLSRRRPPQVEGITR
jgi:hypothetical protein